jgi:hypothetical protein
VHVSHPLEQFVVEPHEVCRFRHFVHVASSMVNPRVERNGGRTVRW